MDRFDEYLEKQSKNESEKFNLPKSLDNKIEETLFSLDSEDKIKNNKWYGNKKLWTTAACFAFICLAGFGVMQRENIENKSRSNINFNSGESMIKSVAEEGQESAYDSSLESYKLETGSMESELESENRLKVEEIYSITIQESSIQNKYKEVVDINEISRILDFINTIPIYYEEVTNEVKEWKYSINVYGLVNHIYKFEDNLVNIDGVSYRFSEECINILIELYNSLNCEEKTSS